VQVLLEQRRQAEEQGWDARQAWRAWLGCHLLSHHHLREAHHSGAQDVLAAGPVQQQQLLLLVLQELW
jgi:hypothetical protein